MEMESVLREIRHLSHKKRTENLRPEEIELQKELREEYMRIFRMAMKGQIEGIKVIDPEGTDVTPEKLKDIQREKGIHGRHLEVGE